MVPMRGFTPPHGSLAHECGEGEASSKGNSPSPRAPVRGAGFTAWLDRFLGITPLYAHCDVPCGIYDPHLAAVSAKTVWTMVKKVTDLPAPGATAKPAEVLEYRNTVIRMISTKEQHAQLCKQELLILWTDYFKPEALSMFPDLHDTFWKAAKLCSYNKQHVDLAKAQELQDAVGKISEMFAKAEAAKKK